MRDSPAQKPKDKVLAAKPPIVKPLVVKKIDRTTKGSYKLTKIQREDIVRKNIVEGISLRDLGKEYGIKHHSVWYIVNNSDKLDQYKQEAKAYRENKMAKIYDLSAKRAIEKANDLTAMQAVTSTAIAWDKLHPQTANINIGDNRSITVQYPNWYGSKREGDPR